MEQNPHHVHHQQPHDHGHHRGLDLDAEVFGGQLAAVLDLTEVSDPRGVVDLGAGTGAGSRMLRTRFPHAAVTCVDNDPQMLERLRQQGFSAVEADLDEGFPALSDAAPTGPGAPVDLVWAASSLHHVAHPAQLLSGIRRALAPGGVLVVVELATLPTFFADPSLGDSSGAALEQRCHTAAATGGWNQYPDWTPVVEAAGFEVTRSEVTTAAPVTPAAREYAREWFGRFAQLASLTQDDRDAVQARLERMAGHLACAPSATRTVWVATAKLEQS